VAVVGVIPAAGYATRLQPLLCSKEVYPINGRPVMDYLLERMEAGGASELRVVTRPDKADVIENARRHGATVIEARPASLADSLATGIAGTEPLDTILLGFPDSLWEPLDGYARILPLLDERFEVALGLFRPREADLRRYETVVAEPSGVVRSVDVKPEVPSSRWIWGCAAARAHSLAGLRGEAEPGRYFGALCSRGAVGSVRLSDSYIDMGTHDGLEHALEVTNE
jgi:NDP-sugar pyrophosphorylase family protein